MTREEYYMELIGRVGDLQHATREYINILWHYGYTLEQAEYTLITNE